METKTEEKKEWLTSKNLEARQNDVDRERKETISQLPMENQEKFAIVENALGELAKAGIPAFIYAGIQNGPRIDKWSSIYQYNTFPALLKHNEDGEMGDESLEHLSRFNAAMAHGIFYTICDGSYARQLGIDKMDWSDIDGFNTVCRFYMQTILDGMSQHGKYLNKINSEDVP